ncbi:Na(+)/H(+) antiporter subunit F [BD1-7 clade bacterium]|uniref:Na(+)/H(+) antiporter subunit F n=1 Tax=BD1-7 clade bacterium TaxID=2029982 RepID=A0A5S9NNP7_9GAMM|nr:Na(+)/H(+) antiporter subunit F [BD1-7 clade bacterium]
MTELMIVTLNIAFAGLLTSFALAFIRLCKGPTLADRVIALDLIAFIVIGFIGTYSIFSGQIAFMDIAITLALVAFLSTIAFARFILKSSDFKVSHIDRPLDDNGDHCADNDHKGDLS